jgi:Family of unknown function (DUF5681)
MSRNNRGPQKPNQPSAEPRKLPRMEKMLLDQVSRKLRIRTDGIEQQITTEDALLRKLLQTALNGSPHA